MLTALFLVVLLQICRLKLCMKFSPLILSTRPAHLILLYFIALIIFREEYKFSPWHAASKVADQRPVFFP